MTGSEDNPEFLQGEKLLKNYLKTLEEKPWIKYAIEQALILQKNMQQTSDSAIKTVRSRFSEISSTSSAHLHQTLESLETVKAEISVYEDLFFGKMKEGFFIAASRPAITCGVGAGLGICLLKRPRRFLFYGIQRLLVSEEHLISRADDRVKELQKAIGRVQNEGKKLEESAIRAEEEMKRGRNKLRHAGNQIQGVIRSVYKIERQAEGLKDILEELPRREASLFRSKVSALASEAKRERNALVKEVSKITNYGISV
ncbi:alanine-tRNA ligase [Tasmannia lanceolata]|uniref:alanine-tRNA ligase n=1 Tax=Tasmannia lanceolata TaxID=3420 RepID=UPI004064457F